jgi:diguanylate cyclase (GGDEF)-like protein
VSMPVLLGSLLTLSDAPMSRPQRLRLAFDGLVVAGGGFMVIWYAYIDPALSQRHAALPSLLSMVVYPPLDLVLILGVCVMLIRGTRSSSPRVLALMLAGAMAYLASDLFISYQTVHVAGWQVSGVVFPISLMPLMLIASAAVEQSRPTDPDAAATPPELSRHAILLPTLALLVGFGLLLFATIGARSTMLTGLVFGALAMVCGVLARQWYALRENEILLATDSLTGLPNRTQMSRVLRRVLERNHRDSGVCAVLLIDLNGFKEVNDTYGHDAGDQLLVAFGRVLREQIRSSDTPARLGGDEFAVVLPDVRDPADAAAVAEKIVCAAGRETPLAGLPVTIRTSIGIALTDGGDAGNEATAQDLLRRADEAMYIAKRAGDGWHLHSRPATTRPGQHDRDATTVSTTAMPPSTVLAMVRDRQRVGGDRAALLRRDG